MTIFERLFAAMLILTCAAPALARRDEAADRAAIHALLVSYGATLDARDFDGFAKLFGTDGVYVTREGKEAKGPEAADYMRKAFTNNANHSREPNFHLFFNEVITFNGRDRAHATSMSLWMVPGLDDNRPIAALSARYEDDLVRKGDRWLFGRRTVQAISNGAPAN